LITSQKVPTCLAHPKILAFAVGQRNCKFLSTNLGEPRKPADRREPGKLDKPANLGEPRQT